VSASVRAGSLRHRITFQRRITTVDSFGGQSVDWSDVATIWGGIEPANGREQVAAQAFQAAISHTITCRYQPWMGSPKQIAGMRVIWSGRVFDLHPAVDVDERHRLMRIPATEGMSNG
jgi:SPP1 family predicted phage head-tail adaptor